MAEEIECPSCHGRERFCPLCNGTGTVVKATKEEKNALGRRNKGSKKGGKK